MGEIKLGDRVWWDSQSRGVWKRKEGVVIGIYPSWSIRCGRIEVSVDTITPIDFEGDNMILGQPIHLKAPKNYAPYRKSCKKIEGIINQL